eukprot:2516587-Pyramimonas_sp.AAC.2
MLCARALVATVIRGPLDACSTSCASNGSVMLGPAEPPTLWCFSRGWAEGYPARYAVLGGVPT